MRSLFFLHLPSATKFLSLPLHLWLILVPRPALADGKTAMSQQWKIPYLGFPEVGKGGFLWTWPLKSNRLCPPWQAEATSRQQLASFLPWPLGHMALSTAMFPSWNCCTRQPVGSSMVWRKEDFQCPLNRFAQAVVYSGSPAPLTAAFQKGGSKDALHPPDHHKHILYTSGTRFYRIWFVMSLPCLKTAGMDNT